MEDHCLNVWKTYIENAGFKKLLIIAHSAGGRCLSSIQYNFPYKFYNPVNKIALTDSYVIAKEYLKPN